jgi:predicted O-linked N-acetylglucosamine transferase (SPINDLY family)
VDQQTLIRFGLAHHQAGRLEQAAATYRAILDEDPGHADALHLLGQIDYQAGNLGDAERSVRCAIDAAPGIAIYHNTLGEIHRTAGANADAEAAYSAAIEIDPNYAEAWSNLGVLARDQERLDDAIAYLRKAVAAQPGLVAAHNNLGIALYESGDAEGAVERYREALRLAPDFADVHSNLGNALGTLGEAKAAIEAYDRALAVDPANPEAEANRAAARADTGDIDGAISGYRRAIELKPDDAAFRHGLGVVFQRCARFNDAIDAFEAALAIDPEFVAALVNLGNSMMRKSRPEEGLAMLERAFKLDPDSDNAYFSLLANLPTACEWRRLEALTASLGERTDVVLTERPEHRVAMLPLAFTMPYFSTDIALHKRILGGVADRVSDRVAPIAPTFVHHRDGDRRKLRLGYLSPDFGDHPIAHVTLPIYGSHDRDRFDVTCYATFDRSKPGGPYFERIRDDADDYVELFRLSSRAAAERIHADGIDILVDLCGFMPSGRPDVLAMKPAPVQVYWLGHGGGLGARYIDYVIGDPYVTAPQDDGFYVEKIARLPDTFSSADRPEIAGGPVTRAEHGLPDEGVIFCGFNNSLKIDRGTFDSWMAILRDVPDSVLWLNASGQNAFRARLRAAAEERGVSGERIVFADRVDDKSQHFARHALADLFLDTFRFNASTTALDSLWAGLPVVTVAGPHFHSRIAAGYLAAVGMEDLICADEDAYRTMAVTLGHDSDARAALKARLASNRLDMPLFDYKRFVRHLESAYETMWSRHVGGQEPACFDVAEIAV